MDAYEDALTEEAEGHNLFMTSAIREEVAESATGEAPQHSSLGRRRLAFVMGLSYCERMAQVYSAVSALSIKALFGLILRWSCKNINRTDVT